MGKKNYQHIVKEQASKLEKAVSSLRLTLGEVGWLHNLSEAATEIRRKCTGDDWSVDIVDMEIPIEDPKHLKPGRLYGNLKLFVSIRMEGYGKEWAEERDCIKSLCFKVEVREKYRKDDDNYFQTGFHIDKMGDEDEPSEMHPLYHVHFLNDSQIKGTEVLAMDVPRLMHHPVDVLLGVLLVYANYNHTDYKKLLENGHFMGLCRNSAKHLLGPYYSGLSRMHTMGNKGIIMEYDKSLCPYLTV